MTFIEVESQLSAHHRMHPDRLLHRPRHSLLVARDSGVYKGVMVANELRRVQETQMIRSNRFAYAFALVMLLASGIQEAGAAGSTTAQLYNVQQVAPGHCTGEPTFNALRKAFGDRNIYAGLGSRISLNPE